MKKAIIITIAALVGCPVLAVESSRQNVTSEVSKELGSLYRRTRSAHKPSRPVRVAQYDDIIEADEGVSSDLEINSGSNSDANSASSGLQQSNQQTYIIQPTASSSIQQQPTTLVEDVPLKESRADQMRKKRIEIEQQTEQRLVERLEDDRISTERERADRVLRGIERRDDDQGDVRKSRSSFDSVGNYPEATPSNSALQRVLEPAPTAPAPVVAAPSVQTVTSEVEEIEEKPVERTKFFVGGMGGMMDYPSLKNVRGFYTYGLQLGLAMPEGFVVELDYLHSTADIENFAPYTPFNYVGPARITQMDQDLFGAAFKYKILKNRFTPLIGAAAGYSLRNFKDRQYNGYFGGWSQAKSETFDMGPLVGFDVNLSDTFSVGADFRYMFNLSYRRDRMLEPYGGAYGSSPIEEQNFYLLSLVGRVQF